MWEAVRRRRATRLERCVLVSEAEVEAEAGY